MTIQRRNLWQWLGEWTFRSRDSKIETTSVVRHSINIWWTCTRTSLNFIWILSNEAREQTALATLLPSNGSVVEKKKSSLLEIHFNYHQLQLGTFEVGWTEHLLWTWHAVPHSLHTWTGKRRTLDITQSLIAKEDNQSAYQSPISLPAS